MKEIIYLKMWPHPELRTSEFCTETCQMELVFHVWMAVRTCLVSMSEQTSVISVRRNSLVWWRAPSEATEAGRPPRTCFLFHCGRWPSDWCCRSLPAQWSCPSTPSPPPKAEPRPGPSAFSKDWRFWSESLICFDNYHPSWRWPGRRRNSGFSSCCRWSCWAGRAWRSRFWGFLPKRIHPELQDIMHSVSCLKQKTQTFFWWGHHSIFKDPLWPSCSLYFF